MSKKQPERVKENTPKLPWIPGLKKPTIDFRVPDIKLPYEAPHKYLQVAIIFIIIFILAGGIYNLTEQPLPMGQSEVSLIPIFQHSSEQFLVESLIAALFLGIGAGGLYLIHYSTRFAYDIRTSITLLILGIILTLVAAVGTTVMYNFKIS
ncbi:MAG: hypothetical protein ACXAC8_01995 [Candidatus Hodarchaeales archaeon]|jgi:hypothetical protein